MNLVLFEEFLPFYVLLSEIEMAPPKKVAQNREQDVQFLVTEALLIPTQHEKSALDVVVHWL